MAYACIKMSNLNVYILDAVYSNERYIEKMTNMSKHLNESVPEYCKVT